MKKILAGSFAILGLGLFIYNLPAAFTGPISETISENPAASIAGRGSLIVYDGLSATLLQGAQPCLTYGEEITPGRNGVGKALKLNPDAWHSPGYSVNCGGQDRLNFSTYQYLEFYIKGNQSSGTHDFNVVSYYGQSATVNILNYVEGGVIDENWRLVSIPLSALKIGSYSLDTVDTLYFGSDSQSRTFYVDDIALRPLKTQTNAAAPVVNTPPPVAQPDLLTLYDGSSSRLLSDSNGPCLAYAEESINGGKEDNGLKLRPDPYHSPDFKVNCGGRGRLDLSGYAAIEFYIKGESADSNNPGFNVVSYFGRSSTVDIKKYTQGGTIDTTWRLVSIPLSDLKTSSYSLNTVDDFYFGTDEKSRTLYIDNLVVTKNKTNVTTTYVPAAVVTPPVVVNPPVVQPPVVATPPAAPVVPAVVTKPTAPVAPIVETPPVVQPVVATAANYSDSLYDFDEIDLANNFGQWLYTENKEYVSLNFLERYSTDKIVNLSNYSITSSDDSNYSSVKRPVSMGYRWRTIYAPTIRLTDLKVAYRIFLKLPSPLENGKTYTITAQNLGITTKPFTFTFNDGNLNQNIKINQVGYLPSAQKIGYVGQYMGTAGPMPFSIPSFSVQNTATGATVFTGKPTPRLVDGNNTGEMVYDLDFSSVTSPGSYVVSVPGVGTSYPFRIGADVYNEVASNALRGAYQQRASTSLTPDITRFTHGPAHMDDAYVMNHNPIPDWFRGRFDSQGDTSKKDADGKRFYYPTTLSGQKIAANKGHYDAGDYGKYVENGSLFVGNLLSAFEAFPDRLMKDDLQIPESGNGIPDLIDETKWELDWLENMQDPNDGGVFCIVKPDGAVEYYEN
jgi:hypothetical protein